MQDLSGRRLGRYELRERLGRGGMAEVYKAYQPGMDRFVAVKVMLGHLATDDSFVERFRREAQAVGTLRHSHIVQIFDFDIEDDVYYMAMEFIQGGTLKDYIVQKKRLPIDEALRITQQLADALRYAHKNGMIHRDLKPANVMFTDDTHEHAVLTDFGIARILSKSGLTGTGMAVGTPDYMSPEAGQGEDIDERTDLYALGVILYEMLTGNVPYAADTPLAVILKHINAPLPYLSQFGVSAPEEVERLVLKCLAKNPEDRFQSADELLQALQPLLNNDYSHYADTAAAPVRSTPDTQVSMERETKEDTAKALEAEPVAVLPERPQRGTPWGLLLGGAAVLLIAVLGALFALNSGGGDPEADATESAAITEEATPTEENAGQAVNPTSPPTAEPPPPTSPPQDGEDDAPPPTAAPEDDSDAAPAPAGEFPYAAIQPPHPENLELVSGLSPLIDDIEGAYLNDGADAAIEIANAALEDDPQNVEALFARSYLHYDVNYDLEAVQVDAQAAIDAAPDNFLGYLALSDYYARQGQQDEARAALEQAQAREPQHPAVLWRVARFADWDEALDRLAEAEEAGARGWRFVEYAANAYYSSGGADNVLRSIPYYTALVQSESARAAYFHTGYLMGALMLTDQSDAALELAEAAAQGETDPSVLGEVAFVAYTAGDYAQARDWAERARALSSEAHEATWVLALVYAAEGATEQALELLEGLEGVDDIYSRYLHMRFNHELPLDRARILAAEERYEDALDIYDAILEDDPYVAVIYEERGEILATLGETDAARADYQRALEIAQETGETAYADALLERVLELSQSGRDDPEADDDADYDMTKPPHADNLNLLSGLSPQIDELEDIALYGSPEAALRRANAILEDDPNNLEALYMRALLQYRVFYVPEEAEADVLHMQAVAPDDPLTRLALHDFYLEAGRWDEAEAALSQAHALAPNNPQVLWRAVNFLPFEEQVEALMEAEQAGARGWLFMQFAAFFYYDRGLYDRSIAYYDALVQSGSLATGYDDQAYLMGALILSGQEEAAFELAEEIAQRESDAGILGELAFVAFRAEEYEQARDWAERARARSAEAYEATWVLAWVRLREDDDLDGALELIAPLESEEFYPRYLTLRFGHGLPLDRARMLREAGELEAALEVYNEVLEDDPYSAQLYAERGELLLELDDVEGARRDFERALSIAEDSGDAAFAEDMLDRIVELGPAEPQ